MLVNTFKIRYYLYVRDDVGQQRWTKNLKETRKKQKKKKKKEREREKENYIVWKGLMPCIHLFCFVSFLIISVRP